MITLILKILAIILNIINSLFWFTINFTAKITLLAFLFVVYLEFITFVLNY